MRSNEITQVGSALSRARRLARPRNIDLRSIGSLQEAQEVQDAAGEAYDGIIRGYTLAATSAATARVLNCSTPIVGKLFDEHIFDSGARFDLPYSMLGVGAQFIFVIGSPLLSPTTSKRVLDSIVSCHLGIQLLGRRVKHTVPLNEWSATADFALDVGCVRGPRIDDWDQIELEDTDVSLQLNGHRIAAGRGSRCSWQSDRRRGLVIAFFARPRRNLGGRRLSGHRKLYRCGSGRSKAARPRGFRSIGRRRAGSAVGAKSPLSFTAAEIRIGWTTVLRPDVLIGTHRKTMGQHTKHHGIPISS